MPYPFDLNRALEGEAVVTRDGRDVRRTWTRATGLVVAEFFISKSDAATVTTVTELYWPCGFAHSREQPSGDDLMMKYPTSQRPVIKKFGKSWACEHQQSNMMYLGNTPEAAYQNFCRQFEE